jgi:hypothetical protein
MGRIFAILLIVLMIWVGLELYLEGPRNAFGGAFASLMAEPNTPGLDRQLSAPKRAGAAVNRAYRETEKRYDKMLDQ